MWFLERFSQLKTRSGTGTFKIKVWRSGCRGGVEVSESA